MLQDLRFALRTFRKTPGFVLIALLTLALGIGANTAMFSVVKAVLLAGLPYPHPDQLVQLWEKRQDGGTMQVSGPNFQDWRDQNHSLLAMARCSPDTVNLAGDFAAQRVAIESVSQGFFGIMGSDAIRGHTFTNGESRTGAAPVAIISYGLWRSVMNGSEDAIGKPIRVDGMRFTVVGVMPPGFDFPDKTQLWVPAEIFPDTSTRSAHNFRVYGRLKSGITLSAAQADMNTVAARLASQYADDKDRGIKVVSLHEQIVGSVKPALLILLGAVAFVLLIACCNIANLQMARASSRVREMALRSALGARRGRLIRQLLTESVVLSVLGGILGLILAFWGVAVLKAAIPANIPRIEDISIDSGVLAFTFALSVLAGLLFGVLPALSASHTDVNEAIKEGSGKATSGLRKRRLGGALVVGEIGVATILLVSAALLVESFVRLERVDPGFRPDGVLTAEISWPVAQGAEPDTARLVTLTHQLLDRVRTLPGVASAGITDTVPIAREGPDGGFEIDGRALPKNPHDIPWADYRVVSTGYFESMRIPLQRGRAFAATDERENVPQVALVNQTFVQTYFPNEDPLGKRIRFFGFDRKPEFLQIIGVVANTRSLGLNQKFISEVFADSFQHSGQLMNSNLIVRGLATSAAPVRSTIASISRDVPVTFRSMENVIAESIDRQRFQTALLSLFATLALVLAALGVYGVLSYTVDRRTAELGIRMALGAERRTVLAMILREGFAMIACGLAAGIGGALLLTRMLTSLLYGVSANDPATYAAIAALLGAVAMCACFFPALRAANTEPTLALRHE